MTNTRAFFLSPPLVRLFRVLLFQPPIKLTVTIYQNFKNIVQIDVKHTQPYHFPHIMHIIRGFTVKCRALQICQKCLLRSVDISNQPFKSKLMLFQCKCSCFAYRLLNFPEGVKVHEIIIKMFIKFLKTCKQRHGIYFNNVRIILYNSFSPEFFSKSIC